MNDQFRDFLKNLRNSPPRQALDALEAEAEYKPHCDCDIAEHEKWARTAWERALDAIIYA